MINFAVENYSFVTRRNPKFVMHFWTLVIWTLLTILAHVAIVPSISINIGAISYFHDVDTSRIAR